ncbi:TraR/DksA C4-type zinc finger protein [Actinotalea sp. K2]|nr:TraR/DksA C4-type zinc finger protein [Actinotalea sp. K2]MCL3861829.1 TraR/DksA C4-type zinc finger protein [Actinotalea sp. K2]
MASLVAGFEEIVAASQHSNADDEHDPEGTTIAFERSQSDALVQHARARLDEVAAARARLARGSYGICEVCGRPIDPERLEVRPTARTCLTCVRR